MKSFFKFLIEASAAAEQARKLGLRGNGHGDWYHPVTGEFEAKTVG